MRCLLITIICFSTPFSSKYYIQRVVFNLVNVHSVQQRLIIIPCVPRTDFRHYYMSRYSSPNIVRVIKSRRIRWAGHVARMGEERGVYSVLLGKPEGRRPLGRPRCRWVDNIRMDLQEVGCGYMDWIGLAQDRDRWWALVSAVMNLRVP